MNDLSRIDSLHESAVPPDAVRAALARILDSPGFRSSGRLTGFLSYVVEEALSGRADAIRAKTIGMDVYGFTAAEIEHRESTVRVDAGRLRRRLEAFYAAEGAAAETVISIPRGSYAPVFAGPGSGADAAADPGAEPGAGPAVPGRGTRPVAATVALGLGGAALLGAATLIALSLSRGPGGSAPDGLTGARAAIFDLAPSRLQALNFADQGRDLIFPATNRTQLSVALTLFEAAIQSDPDYFGGHAGAAQIHATYAVLAEETGATQDALRRARDAAGRAQALAPDAPWSMAAEAWVAFAEGDRDAAERLSRRAVSLDTSDPHLAEFGTLISLYNGAFARVVAEVDRLAAETDVGSAFVFQNAKASALFHLGDYAGAIRTAEAAIAAGAPYGPVAIAYLMAARHHLGDAEEAQALAELYTEAWPEARIDRLWPRLFTDPAQSVLLIDGMAGAGWSPP